MSIELPEARILAQQLDEALKGKVIEAYDLRDIERMIKIGFINKNLSNFDAIKGNSLLRAISRGNTIRLQLSGSMNLLIAPEYGGVITYVLAGGKVPKYHLKLSFTDGSIITVRITSMGLIYVVQDKDLNESYMFKRDFLRGVSPDEPSFTWEWFKETFSQEQKQLKPLLVGKDAHIIGMSNAMFQDVIYQAKIHPKRRASDLSDDELKALYEAIKTVIDKRLTLGGKDGFRDIYGSQGGYHAAMGPDMKNQLCPNCGTPIEKLAYGGGHVYLCPRCQNL